MKRAAIWVLVGLVFGISAKASDPAMEWKRMGHQAYCNPEWQTNGYIYSLAKVEIDNGNLSFQIQAIFKDCVKDANDEWKWVITDPLYNGTYIRALYQGVFWHGKGMNRDQFVIRQGWNDHVRFDQGTIYATNVDLAMSEFLSDEETNLVNTGEKLTKQIEMMTYNRIEDFGDRASKGYYRLTVIFNEDGAGSVNYKFQ